MAFLPKGFKHLPVSSFVVTAVIVMALAGSILNTRQYFLLSYDPFIAQWHQWWRYLLFQLQFQNESQLVVACTLFIINFKSLERLFGTLRFIKIMLLLYVYNTAFVALLSFLCYTVLRINIYIPSGPFGIVFGLLYPFFKFTPSIYTFELQFGGLARDENDDSKCLTFTNNFVTWILAVQFFFSEGLVSSPFVCLIGYFVSALLFNDLLPGSKSRLFLLDSFYNHYTAHKMRSQAVPVPAPPTTTHSRSTTPPENVETTPTDHEEEQTDVPARSLGTQLLDTFRR